MESILNGLENSQRVTLSLSNWYFPGDLLLFAILTYKSYNGLWAADRGSDQPFAASVYESSSDENVSLRLKTDQGQILPDYLQLPASYNLKDLVFYVFVGIISSELMYHIVCGFLQVCTHVCADCML